ncbi:MAG TPA: hypothetical protein VF310_02330 [Vicinamibacteria bacterium]
MSSDQSVTLVIGMALAALVVMLVLAQHEARMLRKEGTAFLCPLQRGSVSCWFTRDVGTGQTRVVACSAFDPPDRVSCSQECVRLMNRGRLALRDASRYRLLQGGKSSERDPISR